MPELSGQCEHELCSKQSRSEPMCLYQCSHCQKMYCLEHLNEHDRYIKEHTHRQNRLGELFDKCSRIFDEGEYQKQIQYLQTALEKCQQLYEYAKDLLSIGSSHSSIENTQKLQTAIEQENQSKSFSHDIGPKVESVTSCQEENRLTTNHGVNSEFKNNNEGDAPQRMVNHPINNIDCDKSNKSKELILPTDDNGATDRVLGRIVVHPSDHDEHYSIECNDLENQIATSKNSSVCTSNINKLDSANPVNEQLVTMNTVTPSNETLDDNIDLESTSSEDSCY
ncbi:unnamed protein product [Rotaria sordida]|uniref:Uncharacterized protein n=1 Tax=Rotaria sordida TaxID=392033 RepID=A0A819Y9N9_9BILA|nr:unnamed protein product [Rotaria sordida]CAF4152877.1 unnamed protein product [Rotaria sordida]